MVINTNMSAQGAANNLQASQARLDKSLSRLSSGSKITAPSDDAGGMAVAMKLDAQIQRFKAAKANVANAISFTQTQDGYLNNIASALDRMSELSVMAQDVTKTDSDRALYNQEFQQLSQYITDSAGKDFNGVSLFNGATLTITADAEGGTFSMQAVDMAAGVYTTATGSNISTTTNAATALTNVKAAISQLASDRASIGSYQSRLNSTAEQITVGSENLMAASSRIQDVDVADEATQFARYNILVQSGTAMLAQANQMPQNVLRLLQ